MSTIEQCDAELAQVLATITKVERMPRTIAERYQEIETELRSAEQLHLVRGLKPGAGHPDQQAHLQRQALIGACMAIGGDKLLKVERDRITAAGEGMSASDKARRLAELHRQLERTACRREIARRAITGGDFKFLPVVHPETLILPLAVLEQGAR